jgi:phosphatidylglycerophosphatase A
MDTPPTSILPPLGRSQHQPVIDIPADHPAAPEPAPRSASSGKRSVPSARFMFSHPAHAMALGFGSGLSPFAPGTVATLWAWVAFLVWRSVNPAASVLQEAAILALTLVASVWASERTARAMGVADPSAVVIDEIIAFWLVLWLVCPAGKPDNIGMQFAAFVIFRFFDAVKPPPVRWADSAFKGTGWRGAFGIVFDDLVAAFCTLIVLALWVS